ncbi:MAG TPA: ABC transporter permease [Chthoniobacterales bacterium]|nr:ABC transporter permease [Chthoniobacterales bacterium]
MSHLRYTIRLLLKSPGFTITAVLILGFGIGANTAIFSLIHTVLLKPLPYPEPEKMVNIYMPCESAPNGFFDYPDYLDYAAAQHTFTALALSTWDWFDLSENGTAVRINGAFVTPSVFEVMGQPFVLGRPFTKDEDVPGGPLVAILTEPFWREHFAADPNILGKNIALNGHTFQVIGVAKPIAGEYRDPPRIVVPLSTVDAVGDWDKWRGRDSHFLFCVGRMKNGVTIARAQADLEVIQRNLAARYPEDKGYGVRINDGLYDEMKDYTATVWLLGAASALLLLISSANVATLLMARASDRRHEMTIRTAMGASRLRLIGRLLLESVLLSLMGGLLGIPVALLGIQSIKWLSPNMPRVFDVSLSPEALLMFFVVAMFTAIASGLIPALFVSKTNPAAVLRGGGDRAATAGPQRTRTQSVMMTCQVALACVLLIGTGLLVRSFQAAQNLPLGFNPHNLLTTEINLVNKKYRDQWQSNILFDKLLEQLRVLPGVTAAAMSDNPPFVFEAGNHTPFTIPGRPLPEPGHEPELDMQVVSPGYFNALQTPFLEGRDFDNRDKRAKDQLFNDGVVIINQALADAFFSGQSPIGKQIEMPGSYMSQKTYTVVGVVQNMRHGGPDHSALRFDAYFPYWQHLNHYGILVLRSAGDPLSLLPGLRKTIASIDPELPLAKVITLDDVMAERFAIRRLAALSVSIFSGTALLLSAVGLYGILAYSVSRQTREIGVRIAIGALRTNILLLVFKRGFAIVGLGITAGLILAVSLSGLLSRFLYGVAGTDPVSIALSVVVLGLAAFLACMLPALRATRINPITALRE